MGWSSSRCTNLGGRSTIVNYTKSLSPLATAGDVKSINKICLKEKKNSSLKGATEEDESLLFLWVCHIQAKDLSMTPNSRALTTGQRQSCFVQHLSLLWKHFPAN